MGNIKKASGVLLTFCLVILLGSLMFKHKVLPRSENSKDNSILFANEEISIAVPHDRLRSQQPISASVTEDVPWGSIKAYDFRPDGLTFDEPATVQFNISDNELPPGVKKESLRVAVLKNGAWKILKDSKFNPISGKIEALINHFSIYGLVPEPEMVSGKGTHFEANGVVADTDVSVYGRLLVSPTLVSFSAEKDEAVLVNLTLSGLPADEEHHVYVNTYGEHHVLSPGDGGAITVPLDLTTYSALVWVQPEEGSIIIGGDDDQCEFPIGQRTGDVCELLDDLENNIELFSGTLDCAGYSITLPAAQNGMGFGILIPPIGEDGIVVENCTIGDIGKGFGNGIQAVGKDTLVLNNNVLIDNTAMGISLKNCTNSYVTGNDISGISYWGIVVDDSSSGNEVAENIIDVDNTGILISGLYSAPLSATDNRILDNTVSGAAGGIILSSANDNLITGNDISEVGTALLIGSGGWPNTVYWNNFYGWSIRGVYSYLDPAEVSDGTAHGNWWGHSCSGPLFTPGVDSSSLDVTDSFPYGVKDAWLYGIPPGCPPEDQDGDTIPNVEDNCPEVWNPGQENVDGFGEGDACDVTPPDPPTITYPDQGGIYDFEISTVEGSAEIRSFVEVHEGEDLIADGYADDSWLFSFTLARALSDGPHNLHAYSKDAAGNISAPSAIVSFEVDLYPPGPPVIIKPVDGDITTSHFPDISGSALPEQLISVYIDDMFSGSVFADAFGEFLVTPSFELADGEHAIKAQAMDGFGRISDFSDTVTIIIYTVSEEEPIEGINSKLAITNISDSPDPFQLGIESPVIKSNANVLAMDGIGGSSPNHTFTSSYRLIMRNADTGDEIRTLEESIDITDAEIIGGKVNMNHLLEWDGKDASGAYIPYGQLYTYDIDLEILKTHRNKKSKCGRAPCIIDEVHLERAGSIIAIEPQAVSQLLFVSNGQFQQEVDILDHLQDINAAGDTDYFEIQLLPDYMITENLDLSHADFIIITEFSPNIPAGGLLNIVNSERPTLIIEFDDFNYSHALGLVTDPASNTAVSDSVDVPEHHHPVNYLLEDVENLYQTSQNIFGISSSNLPEGVVPLIYNSPSLDDAAVFADDSRKFIATGIFDTTEFTGKGWIVFDMLLNYMRPDELPPEFDFSMAMQALSDSGILDMLSSASLNPENWSYNSLIEIIGPPLFRYNLIYTLPDIELAIEMFFIGGYIMEFANIPGTYTLWYVIYIKSDNIGACHDWWFDLFASENIYLPENIEYGKTQAGGIPLLEITSVDEEHAGEMLAVDSPAGHFALSFGATRMVNVDDLYTLIFHPLFGSSMLLDKNDLYPEEYPGGSVPDSDPRLFSWYWWGRYSDAFNINVFHNQPYDFSHGEKYKPILDLYHYPEDVPLRRGESICMLRFYHLHNEDDMPLFSYAAPGVDLPPSADINIACQHSGDRAVFDPFVKNGLPNSFIDALVPEFPLPEEVKPRFQLFQPTNPNYKQYHPIEKWCDENFAPDGLSKCNYFENETYESEFMDALGIYDEGYNPAEHVMKLDLMLPWSDEGPWWVPHVTASIESKVGVVIRREDEALPEDALDVICKCREEDDDKYNIAWLEYDCDENFSSCSSFPDHDKIELARSGNIESDQIVIMSCAPFLNEDHGDIDFLRESLDLGAEEGITFISGDWNCSQANENEGEWETIRKGYDLHTIIIPHDAKGPAKIVWEGRVHIKTDTDTIIDEFTREFPIYIDPIEVSHSTHSLDEASPACWMGATRYYGYDKMVGVIYDDPITKDDAEIPALKFEDYPSIDPAYVKVNNWLLGGNEGKWLKISMRDSVDKLYMLTGDLNTNWGKRLPEPPLAPIPDEEEAWYYDWFHFRGSSLSFFQNINSEGEPDFWNSYGDTQCPVMLPEYIDDYDFRFLDWFPEIDNDNLPFERIRSDGVNIENGIFEFFEGRPTIRRCQETGSETVAATAAFQTQEQIVEGLGKAYLWYGNVTDWGGQEASNPFFPTSAYLHAYQKGSPPWYSFIAEWSPYEVVDDMGKSVRWQRDDPTEWTTFVVNAVVAVEELSHHIDETTIPSECPDAEGPGILVWHAGRYRASPVYFSYAREAEYMETKNPELLYPKKYCHFKGFDGLQPEWTSNEQEAKPVIFDDVGELSVVHHDWDGKYKIFYNINLYGQDGIVMREALSPVGPYSEKIPLFDCIGKQREYISEGSVATTIMWPGGSCYGGFTHTDLWEEDEAGGFTKIRFNVSMWRPYKMLMVETKLYY